jgi:hypothetical protein
MHRFSNINSFEFIESIELLKSLREKKNLSVMEYGLFKEKPMRDNMIFCYDVMHRWFSFLNIMMDETKLQKFWLKKVYLLSSMIHKNKCNFPLLLISFNSSQKIFIYLFIFLRDGNGRRKESGSKELLKNY